MRNRRIVSFGVIALLFSPYLAIAQSSMHSAPVWLEVGVYVEYECEATSMDFLNKTHIWLDDETSATYRWECVDLNETMAKLDVSISYEGETRHIHLSTYIYVNTADRDIFLPNGTLIGKTRLWAPSNPEKNDTVILWDCPPDKLVGTVIDVGGGWSATPQGAQTIFLVDGNGTVLGEDCFPTVYYDLDTGVMIDDSLDYDATLLALGIRDSGGRMHISDTNIDLGPRELWPEILNLLVIAAPITAFLIVFVMVYRRRRRKRQILQRTG